MAPSFHRVEEWKSAPRRDSREALFFMRIFL